MATELQEPIVETQPSLTGDSTSMGLSRGKRARPLFDPPIVRRAIVDSFVKLNPATLAKNPVMFVVEVGAALTTVLMVAHHNRRRDRHRLRTPDRRLALVHRPVRQLRRSHGGRTRQSSGRQPAQNQNRMPRPRSSPVTAKWKSLPQPSCARAMCASANPTTSSPATATSSKASPAWTNPSSPAKARPSSANPAATAAPSPAAPKFSPTTSRFRSPPTPAKPFSTA